jgi:dCMP deaminase
MRISRDQWAMEVAQVTAKRSTCLRRAVGCVLLNAKGHVLSTGYNGVAAGRPHCNEEGEMICDPAPDHNHPDQSCFSHPHACLGACSPSGTNLDACEAIHAEQNALLQCKDVYSIFACYCTTSPCVTCVKLLLNTGCQLIYFKDEYPQPHAKEMWEMAGRKWVQL